MVSPTEDYIRIIIEIVFQVIILCIFLAGILPFKFIKLLFNLPLLKVKSRIPFVLQNNSYYLNLSEREKRRFRERVFEFLLFKKFERINENDLPELNVFVITDEIKIQVATTAVKITFGYSKEYEYKSFHKIIISSKDYVSNYTHKVHKGETNPNRGYVALSWESFQESEKFQQDSIHVGLHEFAHAEFSEELAGNNNDEFMENIHTWHHKVVELCKKQETHDFLRRYAFVNKMEFFAVTMEYFFENPQGLNQNLPELYELMVAMLNQNPLLENNGIVR